MGSCWARGCWKLRWERAACGQSATLRAERERLARPILQAVCGEHDAPRGEQCRRGLDDAGELAKVPHLLGSNKGEANLYFIAAPVPTNENVATIDTTYGVRHAVQRDTRERRRR